MKARLLVVTIFLLAALFGIRLLGQNSSPGPGLPTGMFAQNPAPFDKFVAPPSEPLRWGLSRQAQRLLAGSNNGNAQFLVSLAGGTISSPGNTSPNQQVDFETRQVQGGGACGAPFGTKFNLEPVTGDPLVNLYIADENIFKGNAVLTLPLPQNEESVDFLPYAGLGGSDVIVEAHNDYRGFFGQGDLPDTRSLKPNNAKVPGVIYALNGSVTGVTVHIANSTGTVDCTPSYEMGTPQVASPLGDGEVLAGFGDPTVAANPTNGNIYLADLHFGTGVLGAVNDTAVGVFKTTGSTLTSCQPVGTTNEGDPTACLPVNVMVNPQKLFTLTFKGNTEQFSISVLNDKPDMAVDERSFGIGAGDVYITDTQFDFLNGRSEIGLEVCDSTLTKCSPYGIVSDTTEQGGFPQDQFSNVHVRSDGGISITYANLNFNFSIFPFVATSDIKYISCTPNGAPNFPTCRPAQLITTEKQAVSGTLFNNFFRVSTYPVHDNRDDFSGTKTYVVWTRCRQTPNALTEDFFLPCAKADLSYAFADTTGNPMAPKWQGPFTFDASPGPQFMPWVSTDALRGIVNVAYYTGVDDPMNLHRYKVTLRQILPGSDAPTPPLPSGMLSVDPSADFNFQNFFIGDYLGVAGRGGRAYVGFTYNNDPGVLNNGGTAATTLTEQNNHLTIATY